MEKDEKVVEESVEEAKEAEPIEGADQPEQPQAEGEDRWQSTFVSASPPRTRRERRNIYLVLFAGFLS